MMSDRVFPAPWLALATMLALAATLMLIPNRVETQMRGGLGVLLSPGQTAAAVALHRTEEALATLAATRSAVKQNEELRVRLDQVEQENRRLAQRLQQLVDERPLRLAGGTAVAGEPLLRPRTVVGRVLGQDAAAFLRKHRLIDAGSSDGVSVGDLVLEAGTSWADPPLLDQGGKQGMRPGFAVVWNRSVLGIISEVGPETSRVQLVRDAAFRAPVRLAHRTAQGLRWGARGVLEGTGGALCRLAHVGLHRPVEVGDLVFSAGEEGILPQPLFYGRVEQCSAPPGGSHWEIWVRPAGQPPRLGKVLVLMAELNPRRNVQHE